MRVHQILFLLVLASMLAPIFLVPSSEAHLVGGLTRDDQGFRFQFVTDPSFPLVGEEVVLAFSMQNASNGVGIENAIASVMILSNEESIQSFEDVEAFFGDFAVSHEFDAPGRYTVRVQINGTDEKPSAEFPLEVVATSGSDFIFPIIIVGIVAIIVAVLLIRRRS